MMDYNWFVEHLESLSRQRIKTLVKPIGVTPHRQKVQWQFRDRLGRDVDLSDVFRLLMQSADARTKLEWEYSYPARSEEQWRQRQSALRQSSLSAIADSCRFLVEELGYSKPFEIPATLDDAWILAYRNERAARQVEVSGRSHDGYHCEIRRLSGSEPGPYREESFGDWEIREFREPRVQDRGFVPTGADALAQIVATLKRHPDLLTGEAWLDRADLDAAFEARMRREFLLIDASEMLPSSRPDVEKDIKRVLIDELGFVLTFDSTALTPHESQMWETFRYRRANTTVELRHTDIRVPDEWSLVVNGETVAQTLEGIVSALTQPPFSDG